MDVIRKLARNRSLTLLTLSWVSYLGFDMDYPNPGVFMVNHRDTTAPISKAALDETRVIVRYRVWESCFENSWIIVATTATRAGVAPQ